jgi:hypothetical protein
MKIHRFGKCCLVLVFLLGVSTVVMAAPRDDAWNDEKALPLPATSAVAPPPLDVLTITGVLSGSEASDPGNAFPWKIFLEVNGDLYDLWIVETCVFLDARQREMGAADFFRAFTTRAVTIDFYEVKDGEIYQYFVLECRPGGE